MTKLELILSKLIQDYELVEFYSDCQDIPNSFLADLEDVEYLKVVLRDGRGESVKVGLANTGHSHCPLCEKSAIYDARGKRLNYCGHCGQKLDWSKEEVK